jgi:hypothetical protein
MGNCKAVCCGEPNVMDPKNNPGEMKLQQQVEQGMSNAKSS